MRKKNETLRKEWGKKEGIEKRGKRKGVRTISHGRMGEHGLWLRDHS